MENGLQISVKKLSVTIRNTKRIIHNANAATGVLTNNFKIKEDHRENKLDGLYYMPQLQW